MSQADAYVREHQSEGQTCVLVGCASSVVGVICITDPPKPESRGVIAALHTRGLQCYMVTGDNSRTATAVGRTLGIPAKNTQAEVLPAAKADLVGMPACADVEIWQSQRLFHVSSDQRCSAGDTVQAVRYVIWALFGMDWTWDVRYTVLESTFNCLNLWLSDVPLVAVAPNCVTAAMFFLRFVRYLSFLDTRVTKGS